MASIKSRLQKYYEQAKAGLGDMPIAKAIGGVIANPTPQEFGAQVYNLGSSASDTLQDATKDPMGAALNFTPMGMGTIIGKSAKGWATAEGKFSNMLDRQPRAEISDVGAKLQNSNVQTTLGEILDHPELYKQYPWLKKQKVFMVVKPEKTNTGGSFTRYSPRISRIDIDAKDLGGAKKTLLHEIQHAIQEREGFAIGGNVKGLQQTTQGYKFDAKAFDEYLKTGGEIESRSVAARSNIPQDQLKYSQPYASENIPLKEWIKAEDYLDGAAMSVGEGGGRAKKGGEIGINNYEYKGGQFLPSTQAEPGTWKVGGKKISTSSKQEIAPYKWETPPHPLAKSLYGELGISAGYTKINKLTGKLEINPEFKVSKPDIASEYGESYQPLTREDIITPGIKGILSTKRHTYGELIDAYNNGARWVDIELPPDVKVVMDEASAKKYASIRKSLTSSETPNIIKGKAEDYLDK